MHFNIGTLSSRPGNASSFHQLGPALACTCRGSGCLACSFLPFSLYLLLFRAAPGLRRVVSGSRTGDTVIGKVDLMGPAGEADLLPWTVCRFLSGRWLESWHRQCPPGLAALKPSAGALGLLQGNPHWCWAPTLHPTVGGRGPRFRQVPCPPPGKSLIASCLWAFPAVGVTGAGPQTGTR